MNEFATVVVLGMFSASLLYLGWRRKFFEFSFKAWQFPIRFIHLIGAFAIYFFISVFLSSWLIALFRSQIQSNFVAYSSLFNFLFSCAILLLLALYFFLIPERVREGILKRSSENHGWLPDANAAAFTWVMAFPLVLFIGQFLEFFISLFFQIKTMPDQVAVKFLKSTFEHPHFFFLATISIVVLAPLIEETLFRGFLQSFIRQHIGSKQAILITSVCFSLFHFAAGQGVANISIVFSLFIFSLFLGFLYEKQGSLLAPIFLHAGFNTVSVINLYFFGGFTTGI